jgi:hypothetical protein
LSIVKALMISIPLSARPVRPGSFADFAGTSTIREAKAPSLKS